MSRQAFTEPNRDFGILPFWFLNGELDPDEMRYQLSELRAKGMQGVVFHGRYGLEMPYIGDKYLDRIRLGVEEANRLGLASWIYDEMNWPSGTADKRVLKARPDLAQRYLQCVSFEVTGPWFMCLTGEDSRYMDFQRSTPVAVFAMDEHDNVLDLTSNLSFDKVVPWEIPPGRWRVCYIVEKRADYYIDALDPEATKTFLELGYEPYVETLRNGPSDRASDDGTDRSVIGFYSDEPAMHYFLTAQDNPIVPWTKNMFGRFMERNGYDLRSRLIDLFFDVNPDAARTRHDYYNTTTEFYSSAYYKQLQDWCRDHGVVLTAHLLFEEWLRAMVRVEGNPFRHYENMDVVAVDHLYPVIGTREAPDQHVAIKLASSAAHNVGSERLICESFGGIFMDATMQRMKWITDWEYVLGVNVLNPHGFHYTFEGARKRDWPPSMFYQYPWWEYYGEFSNYVTRLSEMLTGGRHVAKVAVLWPINAMFANYIPQERTADADTVESGLNVITDLLLRLHHDFDYLDEDVLARAEISDARVIVGNEDYELVIVPPMTHVRATTVDRLEEFAAQGGRVLGTIVKPATAFGGDGLVDVSARVDALLGSAFVADDPGMLRLGPGPERDRFAASLDSSIRALIEPDIEIGNPEVFVLHRRKDDRDLYFLANTTFEPQSMEVTVPGATAVSLWDPSSGNELSPAGLRADTDRVTFSLTLPAVGSTFVVAGEPAAGAPVQHTGERGTIAELTGRWSFEPDGDNALVIKEWRAAPEEVSNPDAYAALEADDSGWQQVIAGAWAYQLPVEPTSEWPIPVWYRIAFDVAEVPERLALLIDGFDGEDATIYLNGEQVTAASTRSRIDAQMRELVMTEHVYPGRNVLAVRLVLRDATGGIVDHVKLLGSFALKGGDGDWTMSAPTGSASPGSWTEQGYPFFSGTGVYRTTFEVSAEVAGDNPLLQIPMRDDVVAVELNGVDLGVCLWDPYVVDTDGALNSERNELTLSVANTPANLLNGVARPSGIAGVPSLVERLPSRETAGVVSR
ncbi:MAG: glycosyl hydrolase [Actinomycetota bacterium]